MGQGLRALTLHLQLALLAQRGHGLLWVPVCLALGIGGYFSLRVEPAVLHYGICAVAALAALALSRIASEALAPFWIALALCLGGFLLAGARSHGVAEPVLGWRYYGAVEGRIVALDRSQSDALRVILDRVRLDRVPPHRTPTQVRVSLHGPPGITPEPGLRVMTTAHLSPPSGPVEPGGFDFQRHAWFKRLGAVGYARVPLMGAAPAERGELGLAIFRLRMAASARIMTHLEGDLGGFAAAITTGDRSGMSQTALENLRITNLAHLLAISGLHMGLLTGVVFAALRLVLIILPGVALRWPTKKIAAFGALIAAAVYLALSGGNVATQRAFIMVAVALGALMLGRRALSLRAVAVAATLVLLLRPEALTGPGFQMSFAATTALVATFGLLPQGGRRGFWQVPLGLFLSSFVAGLATAPIAAAHFNTISHYGLLANLASVPLMGVLIIPAAVIALLLAPFGLEGIGLWAMGLGLEWILFVARELSGWEGARSFVPGPGPWVLPLLALGLLFVLLWQGRLRWVGILPALLAFWVWTQGERPAILIAEEGTLVGWMGPQGRVLSRAKSAGFVARNWLENDGDGAAQWEAEQRAKPEDEGRAQVLHLSGKRAVAAHGPCEANEIIVTSVTPDEEMRGGCRVLDPESLRRSGALAFYPAMGTWREVSARQVTGDRLWTRWPPP